MRKPLMTILRLARSEFIIAKDGRLPDFERRHYHHYKERHASFDFRRMPAPRFLICLPSSRPVFACHIHHHRRSRAYAFVAFHFELGSGDI